MAVEKPEAKKLLTKLAQKEEMQMAEALLSTMSRDQQEWENQIGYERFVHDCISREKYAFMKGEKLGVQQGAKANAIENAKKMLRDNVSPEQVSRWISLQLEQVLALKNEMKIES